MNLEKRLKALRKRYKADRQKLINEFANTKIVYESDFDSVKDEAIETSASTSPVKVSSTGFLEFDKIPEYVSGLGISYIHESTNIEFDGYKYELIVGKVKGTLGICKRKIS